MLIDRSTPTERQSSPNIILILSDDQGWGDLSRHGNRNIKTPNMDALASNGAAFSNFYVSPVCSPTRAEILTGRYHPRSGVFATSSGGERINLNEITIAEIFRDAGYATGIFGKWHNGMQYPYHPNGRGFDEFYGFASGHWGNYFSPDLLEHNGQLTRGNGYVSNDFTQRALFFIEKNKDRPFFTFISFNTPHSPMQVPDEWWEKFEDREITMFHREPENEDPLYTRAALAMVENIDWNIGKVTAKLEELDLDEKTIVLFMSDNGPNSWRWNGDMKGRKGSIDEGGVRSPLFIRWPNMIPSGVEIDDIAAAIDLLPTLTDLAGISWDPINPLDGVSLKPLLLGDSVQWDDRLIFSHWNGRTSVRTQDWRMDYQGQLFHMLHDPGQRVDISNHNPHLVQLLTDSLANWESRVFGKWKRQDPDKRPFTVGHPDFQFTQLPARDAIPHGNIVRSNRFPNDTFFTNWVRTSDSITWNVEVLSGGDYKAELYYTTPQGEMGSVINLSFGNNSVTGKVTEAYDPPLKGMENDRVQRMESYVKDFNPMEIGVLRLDPGQGLLTLKALDIPGANVADVRLLMLTRL